MSLPQTAPKINHTEITSGPWRVVPFNIGCNTIYDICSEGGRRIGMFARGADADLAAAAPELLEACKKAEAFIAAIMSFWGQKLQVANWHQNGDLEPFDNFIDDNSDGHTELEDLKAAIAKATKEANSNDPS